MNWIERVLARLSQRYRPRSTTSYKIIGTAGQYIDHDTALTYSAVWAATRVVCEAIGSLSHHVFQKRADGGKKRRDDLPLDYLLRYRPNEEMSAQTFREVLTQHALLRGNGYAEIEWDQGGRPRGLWPIPPDMVTPKRDESGTLYYEVRTPTGIVNLPNTDMFHLKGVGFDGTQGYDTIRYMAGSIGAGMAAQNHASSFFERGATLAGALFHPKRLGKEGRANVREAFTEQFTGARRAYGFAIFEEGMEWKQFSTTPEASQLIETRKFSVTDVARMFKVPPHMIADLERATFTNIEHQAIEFVVHCLLPWAVRWEQEADFKLLGRVLARDHYTKLNLNTLMRGDQKTRYDAYAVGRQWGWLSVNDILEMEDMNPVSGEAGTRLLVPSNMFDADKMPDPTQQQAASEQPAAEPEADDDNDQLERARKQRAAWRR